MDKFNSEHESLPLLNEKIAQLESETDMTSSKPLSPSPLVQVESLPQPKPSTMLSKHHELAELRIKRDSIVSGIREARYLLQVRDILRDYIKILGEKVRFSFLSNVQPDDSKRRETIYRYITIAKDYVHDQPISRLINEVLNLYRPIDAPPPSDSSESSSTSTDAISTIAMPNSQGCFYCGGELIKQEDLQFVCVKCGSIQNTLANITSYQEDSRINSTSRYLYQRRGHFRDTIKKWQGKQNTTIPDWVYDSIRSKMQSYNLPPSKLTKEHLAIFLKGDPLNEYAEDIVLIHHVITGSKPPDISHLEPALEALYAEIEPVYDRLKPDDRSNFINGQYTLYRLLERLKYPCNVDDFVTLKTRDRLIDHEVVWKKICDDRCWTYIPLV